MPETHDDLLCLALYLQHLRVVELYASLVTPKAQDSALIAAVQTIVLSDAHDLEFLGQLLQLEFSPVGQLLSLCQSDCAVGSGDECEKRLGLKLLNYQARLMHFGVFCVVGGEDGYPAIEDFAEEGKLGLVETVGEGVVLLEIFFEEEVVLFGEDGRWEQVLEGKILSDVLQHLPPVEQILVLLH